MHGTGSVSRTNEGVVMSQSLAGMGFESLSRSGQEEIDSRFGRITVNYENPMFFEKGVLGMPDKRYFSLLDFPVKKFAQFRLLQCLDDLALSFITMPLEIINPIITEQDIVDTATDLDIPREYLKLFLIVNIYREMNTVRISVNARAPLFVDVRRSHATQTVLRNNAYLVRHMLAGEVSLSDDTAPSSPLV